MAQILNIDLNKNPEVASLIADMEPGADVFLKTTLKFKDDQTAKLRIEAVAAEPEDLDDDGEDESETGEPDSTDEGEKKTDSSANDAEAKSVSE